MKKIAFFVLILFIANLVFAQYNKIDTSFYSPALDAEKLVDIYFPPEYDQNTDYKYPVIYFFHHWTGNQNSINLILSQTQSLITDSIIDPVIIVCADNSPEPFGGSMYMNSILWGNYEDYMTQDLIEWVDSSFRTISQKAGRALFGTSMGSYGAFRYGILHKEKFCALAGHGGAINMRDPFFREQSRQNIVQENQPGPPYYYDFESSGLSTEASFLLCGAFVPNLNTPQTHINPPIVEFNYDDQGNFIDSINNKMVYNDIAYLIHDLKKEDSVGIYFGCGSNDEWSLYTANVSFKDSLELLGIPYEFYDHNGGHAMPNGFIQGSLIFLDSLLMSPVPVTFGIHSFSEIKIKIYPNPCRDRLIVNYDSDRLGDAACEIIDMAGKLLSKSTCQGTNQVSFDVSAYPSGLYFIRLGSNKLTITQKVIKL